MPKITLSGPNPITGGMCEPLANNVMTVLSNTFVTPGEEGMLMLGWQ